MKCAKCGYISFDYLSVCKKCGVSLNQARSGLGFLESKPEPPDYLKALMDEAGTPDHADATARTEAAVEEITFQPKQALAEEAGNRSDSQVSGAQAVTAGGVETADSWAIDRKWLGLDEPSTPPVVVDMPDVDDLVLELGDDEAPLSDQRAIHPERMSFGEEGHSFDLQAEDSLEDLLFEDFSHESDEGLSLPEAEPELDVFANSAATLGVDPIGLDENVDDLVLELGDEDLGLELEETTANN